MSYTHHDYQCEAQAAVEEARAARTGRHLIAPMGAADATLRGQVVPACCAKCGAELSTRVMQETAPALLLCGDCRRAAAEKMQNEEIAQMFAARLRRETDAALVVCGAIALGTLVVALSWFGVI